jgi:mannose-6-phosphate isomerase-like protein (cupin superfamily)
MSTDLVLENPMESLGDCFGVPDGEGLALWFTTNRVTIKASGRSTGGAFSLWEALVAPRSSPPLHVHHREDESFWVLEGLVSFRCGQDTFTAGPGSFVFLPRDIPHTFVAEGDTPARMLGLATPGGLDEFFVAGGRDPEHDGLPPAAPPDIALLQRISERFGNEIVGPPLPPQLG